MWENNDYDGAMRIFTTSNILSENDYRSYSEAYYQMVIDELCSRKRYYGENWISHDNSDGYTFTDDGMCYLHRSGEITAFNYTVEFVGSQSPDSISIWINNEKDSKVFLTGTNANNGSVSIDRITLMTPKGDYYLYEYECVAE